MKNFLGCLFILILLVTPPIGWIILFVLVLSNFVNNSSNTSSSSTNSSSSSTNTSTPRYTSAPPGTLEDVNNILIDISKGEIRDPYSQETFSPGQKIHFCLTHKLAYHEDSWQEMGQQCDVCRHGGNVKIYTLPSSIDWNQIQWQDQTERENL
jgi:hypothetical protein